MACIKPKTAGVFDTEKFYTLYTPLLPSPMYQLSLTVFLAASWTSCPSMQLPCSYASVQQKTKSKPPRPSNTSKVTWSKKGSIRVLSPRYNRTTYAPFFSAADSILQHTQDKLYFRDDSKRTYVPLDKHLHERIVTNTLSAKL